MRLIYIQIGYFASYVSGQIYGLEPKNGKVKLIQVTRFPLKEVEALHSDVFCIFIICIGVYTPHQH